MWGHCPGLWGYPKLESRLRAHYLQTYGHDSQTELLWTRLVPQLGAQEQLGLRQGQPGGIGLLLRRLSDWAAGAFNRRLPATLATAVVLLALLGVMVTTWVRPATVDAQVILELAQAANTTPLVRSYHLQATITGGRDPSAPERWVVEEKAAQANSATPAVARMILWLDKQSLLPLKWENYTVDGMLLYRYEVTRVQYDIDIPESTFTYTPPPGATITEMTKP